jgi:hypothetical protein
MRADEQTGQLFKTLSGVLAGLTAPCYLRKDLDARRCDCRDLKPPVEREGWSR